MFSLRLWQTVRLGSNSLTHHCTFQQQIDYRVEILQKQLKSLLLRLEDLHPSQSNIPKTLPWERARKSLYSTFRVHPKIVNARTKALLYTHHDDR